MQDQEKIFAFARQEAGDLPVSLTVKKEAGDSYTIKKGNRFYQIVGSNPRCCLYGVYHLIEGKGEGTFTTPWNVRGVYVVETLSRHTPQQLRSFIDRIGKWRFNTFVIYTAYGFHEHVSLIEQECASRGIEIIYYYNTAFQFMKDLDPKRYFARRSDGSLWTESLLCETRPCYKNSDVIERMERSMEIFFREKLPSHQKKLLFAPADGYKVCSCPHCRRLSPMEQWLPVQEGLSKTLRKFAPQCEFLSQVYVHRYRPPCDLSSYQEVDRLFFDTHQRDRWHPLGIDHPYTVYHREYEVDWSAKYTPLNVYLLDRIREWLERLGKPIVVFENLMVHATFSCGQFNTSILLQDQKTLQQLGVDGMLYECYEMGIESFTDELDSLAQAMWFPDFAYSPGKIESWAVRHFAQTDKTINVDSEIGAMASIAPAVLPSFPWHMAEEELDRTHFEYLKFFADFNRDPGPGYAAALVDHLYEFPERFDRLWVGFWILRRLFREKGIDGLSEAEQRFLQFEKLWDFMDMKKQPRKAVDSLVLSIRKKLK